MASQSSNTTASSSSSSSTTSTEPNSTVSGISDSPTLIFPMDDSSLNGSSSTASLTPSSSSPPDQNENDTLVVSPRRNRASKPNKRSVTFGLHRNTTKTIEPYTDSWLSRAELKAIRCNGLCEIEQHRIYFQGYLQTVDAATMNVKYSKEYHQKGEQRRDVKYDDSDIQKDLMEKLTRILVAGCSMGFRGLEHCSKDAKIRRTGRNLSTSAMIAKHRLLFTINKSSKSLKSKERQYRKYCERLSYDSRLWAHYMGMIDASAAMHEYSTIPLLLLRESPSTTVPKVVVVSCSQKPYSTKTIRQMIPTIQLLHSDRASSRRGYQRLTHSNDDSFSSDDDEAKQEFVVYPNHRKLQRQQRTHPLATRTKKAKKIFRSAMERLKSSMEEMKVASSSCAISNDMNNMYHQ